MVNKFFKKCVYHSCVKTFAWKKKKKKKKNDIVEIRSMLHRFNHTVCEIQ
jgi:hypothetical protein